MKNYWVTLERLGSIPAGRTRLERVTAENEKAAKDAAEKIMEDWGHNIYSGERENKLWKIQKIECCS